MSPHFELSADASRSMQDVVRPHWTILGFEFLGENFSDRFITLNYSRATGMVSIDFHVSHTSIHVTFSCGFKDTVYSKSPQMKQQLEEYICEAYLSVSEEILQPLISVASYNCWERWPYQNHCYVIQPLFKKVTCLFIFSKRYSKATSVKSPRPLMSKI